MQDRRRLPFDIYLKGYNTLIEYQGEQHYRPVYYSSEPKDVAEQRYKYVRSHDAIKKKYCKEHNITLICFPYWEFENLDHYLFNQLAKHHIIEALN